MLKKICILFSFLIATSCSAPKANKAKTPPKWVAQIEKEINQLAKNNKTQFGVYIKRLSDESSFSHNGDDDWYLSSTVKVPVAVALLKLVDQKKLKLGDKVTILRKHYRDGAGPTNWNKPGTKVTYKYLLDKMLIYSDNAATDLIIKKVGMATVNDYLKKYSDGKKFGPVTTLLDVRKLAYSEFHPNAKKLSNMDYFEIKKQKNPDKKLNLLAKLMKVKRTDLNLQSLDAGFNEYYAKKWNSAPLTSYAYFLEKIINGKALSTHSTKLLKNILIKVKTGKKRIRKGLPKNIYFAHKTGTQHRQACDMGFAGNKTDFKEQILILVCTKNWNKLSQAEKIMAKVSQIITKHKLIN